MLDLETLSTYLVCPDDAGTLTLGKERLACVRCGREYPLLSGGVLEILPRTALPWPADGAHPFAYQTDFLQEAAQPFGAGDDKLPWGNVEEAPQKWLASKNRQIASVLELLGAREALRDLTLCDISAGSGLYTLEYARWFKLIFHCDMWRSGICYARKRAQARGIDNIVFLRVNYLQLPFRGTLERLICMDTVERGLRHDLELLRQIRLALAPSGRACFDVHNWWHNPLRKLGVHNAYGQNTSYTQAGIESLLRRARCRDFERRAFYQERWCAPESPVRFLARALLPPTRLTYLVRGTAAA